MAAQILRLLVRFMNQKLFFCWFAVLSPMNFSLDIGSRNHKIVFDEMLVRSLNLHVFHM